jgi:hypothetical protein
MAQLNRRSRARRSLAAWVAVAVVAATLLIPGSAALAGGPTNMVLEWNLNAILTIGNPNTPPETTPPTPPGLGQGRPFRRCISRWFTVRSTTRSTRSTEAASRTSTV